MTWVRPSLLRIVAIILTVVATGSVTFAGEHLKQHIKGTLIEDVYTNPERDFRVHVPVHESLGGAVRDESANGEDIFLSQVAFTDDFGWFYRVVSLKGVHKTKVDVYTPLNVFHDIRDKQDLQTERGLELRIINVEKAGAEVVVTTGGKGRPPTTEVPDLVTANAIFVANNRVYHLTVGFPLYRGSATVEQVIERVRKKLETFLAGFEALGKK